jgi:TetR/AcrR family transcriptional repressor of nem operon
MSPRPSAAAKLAKPEKAAGAAVPAAAETRQAIIQAAADLLQKVGYRSFSFRDLAEVVGIRSASIHYHFRTKADLGVALVEWYHAQSAEHERALVEGHPDARRRLLALADGIDQRICATGRSCALNMLQAEFAVLPPAVQKGVRALVDRKFALITRWLEEGRASGSLRFPGDAATQARLVWAVIEYGTQLSRSHRDQRLPVLMRQLVETMSP